MELLIDLNALLDSCEDMLEIPIRDTNGWIERRLEISAVQGNKFVLQQVFSNLIHNALKYRDPSRAPHILVHAWATPDAAEIVVQDNGIGMCQAELPGIFAMYTRSNQSHADGHGIGLYNVKRMVCPDLLA